MLGFATISSLLVVESNRKFPARTIDALSASRGLPTHSVFPDAASMAKNWPRFLFDSPKIVDPLEAGELMNIDTLSLVHRGVACQPFPISAWIQYAMVGLSRPAAITTSLITSGVTQFCSKGVLSGTSQSSFPSADAPPTSLLSDCVMIMRTPPNVARTGDPYAGPSPVHCHLTAPVAASIDVRAPPFMPP